MTPNALSVIFILLPTLVLAIRLLFLKRIGWALGVLPLSLLVSMLTFGMYCESCSSRAVSFNEFAVGALYLVACIYAFIQARAWLDRTPRWKQKPQARDR